MHPIDAAAFSASSSSSSLPPPPTTTVAAPPPLSHALSLVGTVVNGVKIVHPLQFATSNHAGQHPLVPVKNTSVMAGVV